MVDLLADPSMQGRGPGTAGLDRAKGYLIDRSRSMGLAPAFDGRSYEQPFQIKLGVEVRRQRLTFASGQTHDDSDKTNLVGDGEDYSVLGFSGGGSFSGPAVFVGYGIVNPEREYDSYKGTDERMLDGCVAVAFRYEPQDTQGRSLWADSTKTRLPWTLSTDLTRKAGWAAERGATALLIVNPPSQDTGSLKPTGLSLAGVESSIPVLHVRSSLFLRMLALAGREGATLTKDLQRLADNAKLTPQLLKGVTIEGEVELEHPTTQVANVAGYICGSGGLSDEMIVIGAHYDHLGYGQVGSMTGEHAIHPGADDNASGTAAVLAAAERYVGRLRDHDHDAERRAVLFAWFTAEERGLLGSTHFIDHLTSLTAGDSQIVAMVNLDMVGRMQDETLYVMGAETADGWRGIIAQAGQVSGLKVDMDGRAFGGSDHAVFHAVQIPAVHLFTGVHDDYHRVSDTAEKVNGGGLARVVWMVDGIVEQLATRNQRLEFNEQAAVGGGPAMHGGTHAYLGVMPAYGAAPVGKDGRPGGCRINGVSPGGPAEGAGLQRGDVIVRWGDAPVRDVQDLAGRLSRSQPGDRVVLIIQRDGEHIDLEVKLGQR